MGFGRGEGSSLVKVWDIYSTCTGSSPDGCDLRIGRGEVSVVKDANFSVTMSWESGFANEASDDVEM